MPSPGCADAEVRHGRESAEDELAQARVPPGAGGARRSRRREQREQRDDHRGRPARAPSRYWQQRQDGVTTKTGRTSRRTQGGQQAVQVDAEPARTLLHATRDRHGPARTRWPASGRRPPRTRAASCPPLIPSQRSAPSISIFGQASSSGWRPRCTPRRHRERPGREPRQTSEYDDERLPYRRPCRRSARVRDQSIHRAEHGRAEPATADVAVAVGGRLGGRAHPSARLWAPFGLRLPVRRLPVRGPAPSDIGPSRLVSVSRGVESDRDRGLAGRVCRRPSTRHRRPPLPGLLVNSLLVTAFSSSFSSSDFSSADISSAGISPAGFSSALSPAVRAVLHQRTTARPATALDEPDCQHEEHDRGPHVQPQPGDVVDGVDPQRLDPDPPRV